MQRAPTWFRSAGLHRLRSVFSVRRSFSLSSRVTRFSWTTERCWWQRSWFCRLCLVYLSNWESTWPPFFHCGWKATLTTGTRLTSPWLDMSSLSTSTPPHLMFIYIYPLKADWCLSLPVLTWSCLPGWGWRALWAMLLWSVPLSWGAPPV